MSFELKPHYKFIGKQVKQSKLSMIITERFSLVNFFFLFIIIMWRSSSKARFPSNTLLLRWGLFWLVRAIQTWSSKMQTRLNNYEPICYRKLLFLTIFDNEVLIKKVGFLSCFMRAVRLRSVFRNCVFIPCLCLFACMYTKTELLTSECHFLYTYFTTNSFYWIPTEWIGHYAVRNCRKSKEKYSIFLQKQMYWPTR